MRKHPQKIIPRPQGGCARTTQPGRLNPCLRLWEPSNLLSEKCNKPQVNGAIRGFPGGSVVKNLPANAGGAGDSGSIPGSRRFPWRRKWHPTPVFLPGKSHGWRSLADYSA